jgi:hypothetical protein
MNLLNILIVVDVDQFFMVILIRHLIFKSKRNLSYDASRPDAAVRVPRGFWP